MAKLGALTDNFPGSALSAAWTATSGTPTVAKNQLTLPCVTGYTIVSSATSYDLTASAASVYCLPPATGNNAKETGLYLSQAQTTTNPGVTWNCWYSTTTGQPTLWYPGYRTVTSGTVTNGPSVPYGPLWLRIRESAGTTYWDYSADGIHWINQWSVASPVTLTALFAVLFSGFDATESASNAVVSSFNFPPQPSLPPAFLARSLGPRAVGPTFFARQPRIVSGWVAGNGSASLTFAGTATATVVTSSAYTPPFHSLPRSIGPHAAGPTYFATQPRIVRGWVGDTGSGALAFAGSASVTVKLTDTGSGLLAFAGTGTATVKTTDTGSAALTFTGSATAGWLVYTPPFHSLPHSVGPKAAGPTYFASQPRRVTGWVADGGSGTLAFTASATVTVKLTDTGSGQLTFAGTATGTVKDVDTATGTLSFAGSASGTVKVTATAAGTLVFQATSVSGYRFYTVPFHALPRSVGPRAAGPTFFANQPRRVTGTTAVSATGSLVFVGSAAAVVKESDTASGVLTFTASASAAVKTVGTGTGVLTFLGAGTAAIKVTVSGAGSLVFQATGGSGYRLYTAPFHTLPHSRGPRAVGPTFFSAQPRIVAGWTADTASGALAFQGSATPTVRVTDTGAGLLALAGTATASVRDLDTAVGHLTFAGSASANVKIADTGSGQLTFHGAGTAAVKDLDTALGLLSFAGSATAKAKVTDTGSGVLVFHGAATPTVRVVGSGSGILLCMASGAGVVRDADTAVGTLTFTGGATATVTAAIVGTGTGQVTFSGWARAILWPLPSRGGRTGRVNGSQVMTETVATVVHSEASVTVGVQFHALAVVVGDAFEDEDLLVALVGV